MKMKQIEAYILMMPMTENDRERLLIFGSVGCD
jgi:hypothetical protein